MPCSDESILALPLTSMSPKSNVPRLRPHRHQADDHAEIADAIDDERLVRRLRSTLPFDVEADQEIRADAHQFPEHKHHGDVAGQDQSQHAEAEQRQVLEEHSGSGPDVCRCRSVCERHFVVRDVVQFLVHVAHRVEVNARGDQRHHAEHHDRQRVDVVADRQAAAGRNLPSM